jgi:hypothetical protein
MNTQPPRRSFGTSDVTLYGNAFQDSDDRRDTRRNSERADAPGPYRAIMFAHLIL